MGDTANPRKSSKNTVKEIEEVQLPTAPPLVSQAPAARSGGASAPATGRRAEAAPPDTLHAPLQPETVMRTAPPPPAERRRGRRFLPKVRPPTVAKLTTPAPSIELLEEKVRELIALQGEHPDQDLIGDMLMTALRMVRDGSTRGELKILAASLRELRYAFNIFRPFAQQRKITIFGSARTPRTAPEYLQAKTFAEEMVRRKYMVITGAGGGIMEAAQGGAGRAHSFGVNIKLPFEQLSNQFIEGDKKLIHFRYFFTRKLCFVKEASAIALFPGGFGTHDECFEAMTLVQTGKAAIIPIVFIDKPGGDYWREWADYVVAHILAKGLISEDDMHLFKITDDAQWAADEITGFYRRYHSSRFVKDTLVIRMLTKLPKGALDPLNAHFGGILVKGRKITETPPFPEESSEPDLLGLPRLAVPFNRRNYGGLRLLLDEINQA